MPSLDCMVSQGIGVPASVMHPHGSPAFPPAPVDPGGLAAALRPFGESRMLPPAAYTSAEVFAWERRHFLGGAWTWVAHRARPPARGRDGHRRPAAGPRRGRGDPRVREHLPAPRA